MTMKRRIFRALLGVALLATLAATYLVPNSDDVVAASRSGGAQRAVQAAPLDRTSARSVSVLDIRPRVLDTAADDDGLFLPSGVPAGQSPAVPASSPSPAATAVPVAAPRPQAPPLPFVVLGRYVENGVPAFFLSLEDRNLVVRVGDTIGGQYRVEGLVGPALQLRYLPLDQVQTLDVGTAAN